MTKPAFCFLVALTIAIVPTSGIAAPYLPTSNDQILERLPAPGDALLRELRRLRADLDVQPKNLDLALGLARRYVTLGRAEADPRYYGYAQAALTPWWDLANPPDEVMVLRAVLRQNRHDFDGALQDLSEALERRPSHAQALLTRAFVLQVQGRHEEALKDCRRLPGSVHPLIVVTCVGRIVSLTGEAAKGYDLLRQAVERWTDADKRLRLWAMTNLGEIAARTGDVAAAEQHFRAALDLGQRDTYLLGAYADLLLDQDRAKDVLALLDGETRADGLLLRLALAAESESAFRSALEARFAASRRRGSVIHRREEARFALELLNQPDRALDLAKANWAVQREPWDARLVLESALAAGAPREARVVMDWVHTTGLEDKSIETLVQRLKQRNS